ncbi:hypothetical protein Q5Y75_07655 [Ruegeria sp. 2205SS24-7]|uniref:hypothetical protein n=1 Tax=Ruegeria discodermiae TaxID=3064389 RepID=UPI002740840F|nr:hypothetical protein [Ruegeria sp. 2205SS24-7]MDP5217088.1 hypothetical protein [Ruegeria sp. 2205SS24-7]
MSDLYSLWLTFPQALEDQLGEHVTTLARMTKGPVFQPHVTLVGDLPYDRAREIFTSERIGPIAPRLQGRFGRLNHGDTYFQSLFLVVTLPAQVAHVRQQLLGELDLDPAYPPHVSLAYGSLDGEVPTSYLGKITSTFCDQPAPLAFLDLVASSETRPVESWKIIERLPLNV